MIKKVLGGGRDTSFICYTKIRKHLNSRKFSRGHLRKYYENERRERQFRR